MKILFLPLAILANFCCFSQHIISVGLQDFNANNLSVLADLKSDLKDVSVIGLGESTHSVGTTFEAKAKLIEYLHDSLGFNVLAFESGMYDCNKSNYYLKKGDTSLFNIMGSIFRIWGCKEVSNLAKYIIQTQKTAHPLIFAGFDNQFCFNYSARTLAIDFKALIDSLNNIKGTSITPPESFYTALKNEVKFSNSFHKLDTKDTSVLHDVLTIVIESIANNKLDTSHYYSFWKKICYNLVTDFESGYLPKGYVRDSIMAQNIEWLKRKYPNEKIILWAASSHLSFNVKEVKDNAYRNLRPVGFYLKRSMQEQYYFLAFTANMGRGGYRQKGLLSYKFPPASRGSLEYGINNVCNCDYAYLSFRNTANQNWVKQSAIKKSKVFFRKEIEMDVSAICDGIFYIKQMHPPFYNID